MSQIILPNMAKPINPFEQLLIETFCGLWPTMKPDMAAMKAQALTKTIIANMQKRGLKVIDGADMIQLSLGNEYTQKELAEAGTDEQTQLDNLCRTLAHQAFEFILTQGVINIDKKADNTTAEPKTKVSIWTFLFCPRFGQRKKQNKPLDLTAKG